MNYDSMSVHELLGKYAEWANKVVGAHWSGKAMVLDEDLVQSQREGENIASTLRKAVIRESSVGEISIEQHEGYMSPDPMFTVGAKSKLKAGEFYIVPREKT